MIFSRIISFLRDVILFCVLMVLIGVAYKRAYWYLIKHEKTMIHQLDRTFLHQIHMAQKQLRDALQILENKDETEKISQLNSIRERLKRIEERYQKNSPGLVFLGPIATVSIVLKEKQLENELLDLIQKTGAIISDAKELNSFQTQKITIDSELTKNKLKISDLLRT